jgi:hypothetical protein
VVTREPSRTNRPSGLTHPSMTSTLPVRGACSRPPRSALLPLALCRSLDGCQARPFSVPMMLAVIAWGPHPFPSRTRPLSPTARMVLLVRPVGEYVAANFTCRKSPPRSHPGAGSLALGHPARLGPGRPFGCVSGGPTGPALPRAPTTAQERNRRRTLNRPPQSRLGRTSPHGHRGD